MAENIQEVAVNLDLTRNIWCFKYKARHTRCAREKCEGARAKEGGPGVLRPPSSCLRPSSAYVTRFNRTLPSPGT